MGLIGNYTGLKHVKVENVTTLDAAWISTELDSLSKQDKIRVFKHLNQENRALLLSVEKQTKIWDRVVNKDKYSDHVAAETHRKLKSIVRVIHKVKNDEIFEKQKDNSFSGFVVRGVKTVLNTFFGRIGVSDYEKVLNSQKTDATEGFEEVRAKYLAEIKQLKNEISSLASKQENGSKLTSKEEKKLERYETRIANLQRNINQYNDNYIANVIHIDGHVLEIESDESDSDDSIYSGFGSESDWETASIDEFEDEAESIPFGRDEGIAGFEILKHHLAATENTAPEAPIAAAPVDIYADDFDELNQGQKMRIASMFNSLENGIEMKYSRQPAELKDKLELFKKEKEEFINFILKLDDAEKDRYIADKRGNIDYRLNVGSYYDPQRPVAALNVENRPAAPRYAFGKVIAPSFGGFNQGQKTQLTSIFNSYESAIRLQYSRDEETMREKLEVLRSEKDRFVSFLLESGSDDIDGWIAEKRQQITAEIKKLKS